MSLWLAATLFASAVQALRFLLQKRLAQAGLSAAGSTLARFVWAPPVLALALWAWSRGTGTALPAITEGFWSFAIAGAASQILATMCVVALFAHRNFAVGIAFSKTTVLMTVAAGYLVLGEAVTWAAFGAMALGFVGVLLLSVPADGGWRLANTASLLGLASGAFFTVSAIGYRGASLAVASDLPILRAAVTLTLVTVLQTAMLAAWMAWRERAMLRAVFTRWRVTMLVGATSVAGSLGWFTAYTLQTAAYVNAVGQVELVLSVLISWFVLGERQTVRESAGILLVGVSVVGLILLTA
ncbi:DMT family transporter [Jannaschia ovalis]|uniref:DMT family transporter n=1 Tax=Jannaschia ovalis TaxID=3038773 RepID=A0ABY8LBY7_9RHOB|nr:DMT family transporter [Jannaschia sp. GRR-S6-38]WGH77913.1 DMT family transporter [Jannaschia sp. GRR-S6-38]